MSMIWSMAFTGLFTLGQPGFMAIGAYVYALLSLTPQAKAAQFYIKPIVPFLGNVQLNPWIAMIVGGFAAAVAAFLIGFPVLRLKGDYPCHRFAWFRRNNSLVNYQWDKASLTVHLA